MQVGEIGDFARSRSAENRAKWALAISMDQSKYQTQVAFTQIATDAQT